VASTISIQREEHDIGCVTWRPFFGDFLRNNWICAQYLLRVVLWKLLWCGYGEIRVGAMAHMRQADLFPVSMLDV
jgi:hypothetical protein